MTPDDHEDASDSGEGCVTLRTEEDSEAYAQACEQGRISRWKADMDHAARRRLDIARCWLNRMTAEQISAELGISTQLVQRDLIKLRKEWQKARREALDAVMARELAELQEMERQAAERFRDSSGVGSSRWLQVRLAIKERRAKMLGLDQPTKHDLTSDGEPIGMLSPDDVQAILVISRVMPAPAAQLLAPRPVSLNGGSPNGQHAGTDQVIDVETAEEETGGEEGIL